jgi:hypothetical protein
MEMCCIVLKSSGQVEGNCSHASLHSTKKLKFSSLKNENLMRSYITQTDYGI